MKPPIFIGVDGGGTKTTAAVCDGMGKILAYKTTDSANMLSRTWSQVEKTLHALLDDVICCAQIYEDNISTLFLGLAGADRPAEKRNIESSFAARFGSSLFIDNDAGNALYSGTLGRPGIVLIAGTGSIAYAVDTEGNRHRTGGWGYLFGDEGSGFDLGRQALIAIFRELDGRGTETSLAKLVLQHYGVGRCSDLISMIYGSANPRSMIAELAPLVLMAAEQGDQVSSVLVNRAAAALVELVVACERNSGAFNMPIVLTGGLLSAGTLLQQQVQQQLQKDRAIIIPKVPPVVGSLVCAMQHGSIHISDTIKRNLVQSWSVITK